jgi:hypothetical protein
MRYFKDLLGKMYTGTLRTSGGLIVIGCHPSDIAKSAPAQGPYAGLDDAEPGLFPTDDICIAAGAVLGTYDFSQGFAIRHARAAPRVADMIGRYRGKVATACHYRRYILDPAEHGHWEVIEPMLEEGKVITLHGKSLGGDPAITRLLIEEAAGMLGDPLAGRPGDRAEGAREAFRHHDFPAHSRVFDVAAPEGLEPVSIAHIVRTLRNYPGAVKLVCGYKELDGRSLPDTLKLCGRIGRVEVVLEAKPGLDPDMVYAAIGPYFRNGHPSNGSLSAETVLNPQNQLS